MPGPHLKHKHSQYARTLPARDGVCCTLQSKNVIWQKNAPRRGRRERSVVRIVDHGKGKLTCALNFWDATPLRSLSLFVTSSHLDSASVCPTTAPASRLPPPFLSECIFQRQHAATAQGQNQIVASVWGLCFPFLFAQRSLSLADVHTLLGGCAAGGRGATTLCVAGLDHCALNTRSPPPGGWESPRTAPAVAIGGETRAAILIEMRHPTPPRKKDPDAATRAFVAPF